MSLYRGILVAGKAPVNIAGLFPSLVELLQAHLGARCELRIRVRAMSALHAFLVEFSPRPSAMLLVELAEHCARQLGATTWAWAEERITAGQPTPPTLAQCTSAGLRATWPFYAAQSLNASVFMLHALQRACPYEFSMDPMTELGGLQRYFTNPPPFPREDTCVLWGFLIPSLATKTVARVLRTVREFFREAGAECAGRRLRVSRFAGLEAVNIELTPASDDAWQAERPCIDLYTTLGKRLAEELGERVYQWRSGYLYRFRAEQKTTLLYFEPDGASTAVAQPDRELAERFGLANDAELWELAQTAAFEQPLDTDLAEAALADYLAYPPPKLTAGAAETYQSYRLPRWMLFEAAALAAKRSVTTSAMMQLAWEAGKEALYERAGSRSTWPQPAIGAPPAPAPADDELLTILVSSTWDMVDEGLELYRELGDVRDSLADAYRAARPMLLSEPGQVSDRLRSAEQTSEPRE